MNAVAEHGKRKRRLATRLARFVITVAALMTISWVSQQFLDKERRERLVEINREVTAAVRQFQPWELWRLYDAAQAVPGRQCAREQQAEILACQRTVPGTPDFAKMTCFLRVCPTTEAPPVALLHVLAGFAGRPWPWMVAMVLQLVLGGAACALLIIYVGERYLDRPRGFFGLWWIVWPLGTVALASLAAFPVYLLMFAANFILGRMIDLAGAVTWACGSCAAAYLCIEKVIDAQAHGFVERHLPAALEE